MKLPPDFQIGFNTNIEHLPSDAAVYFGELEYAADNNIDLNSVEIQGLSEVVDASKAAIKYLNEVFCGTNPNYNEVRKQIDKTVIPAVNAILALVIEFGLSEPQAKAIAYKALAFAQKHTKNIFCEITNKWH